MIVTPSRHRNSQQRIHLQDAWYFVTTVTKDRYPFFQDPNLADLCTQKIFFTSDIIPYRLGGFVILPNHMHILLQTRGSATISAIIHCMKRNISRGANILIQNGIVHVPEGDDDHRRLRGWGVVRPRKFAWQKSYHDHIIRDQRDMNIHIDYLRLNPIKHRVAQERESYPWMFITEYPLYG